jgi:hypothetical protein
VVLYGRVKLRGMAGAGDGRIMDLAWQGQGGAEMEGRGGGREGFFDGI